jgi:signal peptidase I
MLPNRQSGIRSFALSSLSDKVSEKEMNDDVTVTPYLDTTVEEPIAEAPAEEERSHNWETVKSVLREIVETVVLTLVIFFLIQLVVRNFRVVGTSMEPNLHTGEYLIVDKISYRLGPPQRGDVVVFEPPVSAEGDYVKRIIGLPGELVEIRSGQVFINGKPIEEPYAVRPASYSMDARRVGPDELFVLGDNRNMSSDSHSWGMLPMDKVVGKAIVSYWPPSLWGLIPRDAPTASATVGHWLDGIIH